MAAAVAVLRFGPPNARYAVEQISVRCACAEESLASIIRRLLRGDVPTSVWWAEDVSAISPIESLVSTARQLVYDSRRWRDVRGGVAALTPFIAAPRRLDLADLNWRRLAPLRQAVLHAATIKNLDALRDGRISVAHRPGDGALAWLVVGWLSARLGWSPSLRVPVREVRHGDDVLTLSVGEGDAEFTATMNSHRVVAKHRSGAVPLSVPIRRERESDAIAAELRNLAHDMCLDDTLTALAARFSAAASS